MNFFPIIRTLYTPVQPAVENIAENVTYTEFLPDARLGDYIYCYWQLKSNEKLSSQFSYRVVADGCMDVFFEPGNEQESFVMGFCKNYTMFPLEDRFNYIGIRFLPTMFAQLYNVDAHSLSNRVTALSLVLPGLSRFIDENFYPRQSIEQIIMHLDDFLLKQTVAAKFNGDARLYDAISIILNSFGTLNIETDLATGISPRQLRRLFHFYIGDSPKTFSKVVRFQNILKAKPSVQSLKKNKLFFDAGYFDQAHFIKEFKNFYGVTPTTAFGR